MGFVAAAVATVFTPIVGATAAATIGTIATSVVVGAAVGAVSSAVFGGDIGEGAIAGAVAGGIYGTVGAVTGGMSGAGTTADGSRQSWMDGGGAPDTVTKSVFDNETGTFKTINMESGAQKPPSQPPPGSTSDSISSGEAYMKAMEEMSNRQATTEFLGGIVGSAVDQREAEQRLEDQKDLYQFQLEQNKAYSALELPELQTSKEMGLRPEIQGTTPLYRQEYDSREANRPGVLDVPPPNVQQGQVASNSQFVQSPSSNIMAPSQANQRKPVIPYPWDWSVTV